MAVSIRSAGLALFALFACDAPTREEIGGLQQRLDTVVADTAELRKQNEGLVEGLRKQQESAAAQTHALEATTAELAVAKARIDTIQAKLDAPPPVAPPPATPPVAAGRPDPTVRYRVDIGDSNAEGAADAKVTLVVFSDFQCPFCARAETTLTQLQKDYGKDLRVVAKYNPLGFHAQAAPAARAAEAAGKQGKFWEMHDKLYQNNKALGDADLEGYAKALGLDLKQFRRDADSKATDERIAADIKQAKELGARGTPSFFVNGKILTGAQPLEKFKEVIDAEIAEADRRLASGVSRASLYADLMATATPGIGASASPGTIVEKP